MVLYVDDILIAPRTKKLKGRVGYEGFRWNTKNLRNGDHRDRDQKKLFLSQKIYIQKILHKFDMSTAKPLSTPSTNNVHFSLSLAPQSEDKKV